MVKEPIMWEAANNFGFVQFGEKEAETLKKWEGPADLFLLVFNDRIHGNSSNLLKPEKV